MHLFPVTVDDGIDVHVNELFALFLPLSNFFFYIFPFLTIFNFYIIKINHISKTFLDPPVWGTVRFGRTCCLHFPVLKMEVVVSSETIIICTRLPYVTSQKTPVFKFTGRRISYLDIST
jgi:hypothetical protein